MDPLFNVHHSKVVPDSEIDKYDIMRIGRELKSSGLISPAARLEFEKLMNKAQSGGLKREEVHDLIQKLVVDGKISKPHAVKIARTLLGSSRKDLIYFKDISEARSSSIYGSRDLDDGEKKPSLHEIAVAKEKQAREESFQRKMDEIKMKRLKDSDPESFAGKSQPSRAELYLSARESSKDDRKAVAGEDTEESKSLHEKAEEKRKAERELKFRSFMENMKNRKEKRLGEKDAAEETSGPDYKSKPIF